MVSSLFTGVVVAQANLNVIAIVFLCFIFALLIFQTLRSSIDECIVVASIVGTIISRWRLVLRCFTDRYRLSDHVSVEYLLPQCWERFGRAKLPEWYSSKFVSSSLAKWSPLNPTCLSVHRAVGDRVWNSMHVSTGVLHPKKLTERRGLEQVPDAFASHRRIV